MVDAILLGIVGSILGAFLFGPLSDIGQWALLIGAVLSLTYYAGMTSASGNGQTFGMRLLQVQITDENGALLSPVKAFVRSILLFGPWFLKDIALPQGTPGFISEATSVFLLAWDLANMYLVLFNRRSRQGLHDLAVGSYGVSPTEDGPVVRQNVWLPHWIIIAGIIIVVAGDVAIVSRSAGVASLFTDAQALLHLPQTTGSNVKSTWQIGTNGSSRNLVATVNVAGAVNEQALSDQAAQIIFETDPSAAHYGLIEIVIGRGYNLGIAQEYRHSDFVHTPVEWHYRLAQQAPPPVAAP